LVSSKNRTEARFFLLSIKIHGGYDDKMKMLLGLIPTGYFICAHYTIIQGGDSCVIWSSTNADIGGLGVNRACGEREYEVTLLCASETVAALSAFRSGEMRGVCGRRGV
jgi:hypothetical protein